MNVVSEQVKELRNAYHAYEVSGFLEAAEIVAKAADTIEALSAKLEAANTGGWIPCSERLPSMAEYMESEPTTYMKRLEIAYMTDAIEYAIGYYDGSKWIDKRHNIIKNVVAWKVFIPFLETCHE